MEMRKLLCGRKRKAFSLAEILVALAIIVALGSAAFFGFNHVQTTRRIAQATQDVQAIAQAALTYESLCTNGLTNVSQVSDLQNLAAADATDGVEHSNILKGNTTDPWNVAYEIDVTNRVVYSDAVADSHQRIEYGF